MRQEKPSVLYRGVVISYDKLDEFDLEGDLVVPYDPIIDEKGEKTVLDGNEYGVYMTTNQTMVYDVYGNVHGGGTKIQKGLAVGDKQIPVAIPDVAVSYKINTEGLDVRKPKITSYLTGHYNNGFEGEEWIADKVPNDKYQVTRVRVGKDLLHDSEDISITDDINKTKSVAKEILEGRKIRLTRFAGEISKMSDLQRRSIDYIKMKLFKDLFGQNGICYTDINDIDVSSNMGKTAHLMSTVYNQNTEEIDYRTLEYIEDIKQKLSRLENPEAPEGLKQIISNDLSENNNKRDDFIQRKTEEGVEYTTTGFDRKNDMMSTVLSQLDLIDPKEIQVKEKPSERRTFDFGAELRQQVYNMKEQVDKDIESGNFFKDKGKNKEQDDDVEKTDDDFIM